MSTKKITPQKAKGVTWDLKEFFKGLKDPILAKESEQVLRDAESFYDQWKPILLEETQRANVSSDDLLKILNTYDQLIGRFAKVFRFIYCLSTADTSNKEIQVQLAKLHDLHSRFQSYLTFLEIGLQKFEPSQMELFFKESNLQQFHHYLRRIVESKPYTLSEKEENLIYLKNVTGKSAWVRFFDQATSAFRYRLDPADLEEEEKSESEVRSLRYSPDRSIREKAVKAIGRKYKANSSILTPVFNQIFKDHINECRLRGYTNPMEPVHMGNELSPETIETMMSATEEHYHLAQRYFKLKAKLLGFKKLEQWDVLAPLESQENHAHEISWEEARERVVKSYRHFDSTWGDLVQHFIDAKYVEAENRTGKRGGAYCCGFGHSSTPRVFMTFTGSRRDLSTLAHELGHAVHFYLSRNQKNINYHAVLPMAETASVFGEMLLTKNILAEEQNPEARKQLLANKIEDMINTVFAQNAYTRFEQLAYQKRDEKECSTEELGEIWVDQFKRFYGDAVDLSPLHQYVWQGIPHFVHTRFYCYAYTFGELLSLSLYRQYEENPESEFKKQLNTLLSKGCSEPPQKMLEPFEIDLKSKAFWKNGFKVIEEFIHELEKIS